MNLLKKLAKEFRYYVTDVTATITEVNPIFAAFEVGIVGMSEEVSRNARLTATTIGFAGVGYLFSRGRDVSRKVFKITDNTKEKIIKLHDKLYAAAFSLVCSPGIYYVSGAESYKEIAIGTCIGTIIGGLNGGFVGCSIDVFRDLTGLDECNRKFYPDSIKKTNSKLKKVIAGGLVTTSLGLLSGIYALIPNKENPIPNQPTITQTENNLESIVQKQLS